MAPFLRDLFRKNYVPLAWARPRALAKPAIDLYTKVGFLEVGRVADMFRVKGQKIEDIQMVINLRR